MNQACKYIFFTNIPAPYRISFYNELHQSDLDFEVYYMRSTEGDRSWKVDLRELKHPYYIDDGFYMMFGRFHFHFNPKLLLKLFRSQKEIIIGGSWNDINVLILVMLKRLGLFKNTLHFWSEANYLTIGASHDNLLKKLVRKFVYNSSNGAQLSSGKMVEITFEKWGMPGKTFLPLPNTIEEEHFELSREDVVRRDDNGLPIFLLPARLDEKIKGIVNFFSAIGEENIRKAMFWIAGEGPDREVVEGFIALHRVEAHVKLLGHCDLEKLVSLYRQANVFVLPSFTDASPLALVEALRMELPVLVSDRCGNHFEAVEEGGNGFLLDPFDARKIKSSFEALLLRRKKWRLMGERSAELYRQNFGKKGVVEKFVSSLTEFSLRGQVP